MEPGPVARGVTSSLIERLMPATLRSRISKHSAHPQGAGARAPGPERRRSRFLEEAEVRSKIWPGFLVVAALGVVMLVLNVRMIQTYD
jgi:hypothetical protein